MSVMFGLVWHYSADQNAQMLIDVIPRNGFQHSPEEIGHGLNVTCVTCPKYSSLDTLSNRNEGDNTRSVGSFPSHFSSFCFNNRMHFFAVLMNI